MNSRAKRLVTFYALTATSLLPLFRWSALAQDVRVPPAVEASDCNTPPKPGEHAPEKFKRKGGRREQDKIVSDDGHLTVKNIAQGRDLGGYDHLRLNDPSRLVIQRDQSQVLAHARTFLYEHWRDHKRAYLVFTGRSVD